MKKAHLLHLYQRAGFGISPLQFQKMTTHLKTDVVNELFKPDANIEKVTVNTPDIDTFLKNYSGKKDQKKFRELIKQNVKKTIEFNNVWLDHMASSSQSLRERMTLFWATHFVVRSRNIMFLQKFNNTLRTHALGNFKDLVIAISKEPAMLDYLNNQQNKKGSPNENFARELMELFTLGEGTLYSEKDIKESARAFTGWGHTYTGDFINRKPLHDEGQKTFLGKVGNFDGADIIAILLKQPECATFMATKIYKYFVNNTINKERVAEMAKVFYPNYNIEELMKFVFTSDWFYADENVGNKIKSPIDLLIGLKKVVPFTFNNPRQLIYIERLLGQVLVEPPNVAGWPEGRGWIDANTMMVRMKLPSVLLKNGSIAFDVRGEFEDSFEKVNKKSNLNRKIEVTAFWNKFDLEVNTLSFNDIKSLLIRCPLNEGTKAFLKRLKQIDKQEYCIQLMSLPEYQLS